MEENLHKDNLESFFKKELEKLPDTTGPEGWDMPSADVWSGIEANISSPEKNVFLKKYWLPSLLFLILFSITFFLFYKNNQLSENLHLQKIEIAALNDSLENEIINKKENKNHSKIINTPNEAQAALQNDITPLEDKEKKSKIAVENILKIPTSIKAQNKPSQAAVKPETTNALNQNDTENLNTAIVINEMEHKVINKENSKNKTTVSINNVSEGVETPASKKNQSVSKLSLPFTLLNNIVPILPKRALVLSKRDKQTLAKSTRFYAGSYISPNFSSNSVKSRSGGRPLFKSTEKSEWSNEKGFKIGFKFGDNWKISSGIGWYSAKIRSQKIMPIHYNSSNQTIVGDKIETTYGLRIESSYGTSDVDVDFRYFAMQAPMHGEVILLNIRTKQELQFINIPLLLGYEVKKGRLALGVQAGVAVNILKRSTFEAEISSRRPGFLRHNGPRVVQSFSREVRKTGLDYVLSTNIAYALTPSVQLSLAPVFRKNITPITDTPDFSNKLYSVGVHLGAYFSF